MGSELAANVYSLQYRNNEIIASTDNGLVFILNQDRTLKSKFKAHNSAIPCIGFVNKGEYKNALLTISNEGIMSLWDDNQDLIEQF